MIEEVELQREIELARLELDESLIRGDEFDEYYQKSTRLDKLVERYIELMEQD